MTKDKYQEYALIKSEIKALEFRAKAMEIDIINDIDDMEGKKLITSYATFSLVGKKKYEYTAELQDKEALVKEQIKLMKHKEESDGKATLIQDGYQLRCQVTNL